MMIGKNPGFGRSQPHNIISREIIKPSSRTPSHLKTYNLSMIDQLQLPIYIPIVLFYPNNEICGLTPHEKAHKMKRSLSQSLTRYYPFAGRIHTPTTPYVDCNDEGVVFVETKYSSQMSMSQDTSEDNDIVGQLYVDGMFWEHSPYREYVVGVQVNHFACGGMAVAVSLSHRVGDGCTLGSFLSHWASVARHGSVDHKEVLLLDPHFIHYPATTNFFPPEVAVLHKRRVNAITRKFVFPNSKLSDLKNKVLALAKDGSTPSINNPTRVEVLISLIYKTVLAASTLTSSSFKPSFLSIPVNMRNKFVPKLPQTTVGNITAKMLVTTRNESETSLTVVVSEIQKQKMELERLQNLQLVRESFDSNVLRKMNFDLENVADRYFLFSSLCGFPYNKVDFGWGKPAVVGLTLRSTNLIGSMLMDTPNRDGIEALVTLDKQDMERFQNDKELLSFCKN
ncbi:akuammiline synthase 1-like [Bidens hawaiensis]|uniref:akuammiline synthase 1-like n=1 Tax=Bidens hawaiensis TaxID=980011 RepID=UPI004049813E